MTLANVLDRIAAMVVATADLSPTVYGYTELPTQLNNNQLPVRLILPTQGREADSTFSVIQLGASGLAHATRRVTDLLLYRPATEGQGQAEAISKLVAYVDAYEGAVQTDRSLGMAGAFVNSVRSQLGVFEWPAGGTAYFGVAVILEVEDYVA